MRPIAVADAHVDVLMRMNDESKPFYGETSLQAGHSRLRSGNVAIQVFALFVWPSLPGNLQLEQVLQDIDIFYRDVVEDGELRAIRTIEDLELAKERGEIAGLLSLEGGGALRGQVRLLRILHDLGVRGVGLTWNHANELADGCREARGGGLTAAGKEVVKEMERLGMWIDFSHLADKGVADILALTDAPVMASHANCRSIHEHPRNLTDDVIREIIRRGGWMGLTFEGSFVDAPEKVSVDGLLRHLDHVLQLGGEDIIGFGSDFDGTSNFIPGLTSADDYRTFTEQVAERYGEDLAKKISSLNFERYLRRILA